MLMKTSISTFLLITFISFSAHSALITKIDKLEIGGTDYKVTFNATHSFNAIFDADGDGGFGEGDSSLLDRAPAFWNDRPSAGVAADAIIEYLGSTHYTSETFRGQFDAFQIPVGLFFGNIVGIGDGTRFLDDDFRSNYIRPGTAPSSAIPYAIFELASTSAIPTPPTLALAGLALVFMGVVGRRRRVS